MLYYSYVSWSRALAASRAISPPSSLISLTRSHNLCSASNLPIAFQLQDKVECPMLQVIRPFDTPVMNDTE